MTKLTPGQLGRGGGGVSKVKGGWVIVSVQVLQEADAEIKLETRHLLRLTPVKDKGEREWE